MYVVQRGHQNFGRLATHAGDRLHSLNAFVFFRKAQRVAAIRRIRRVVSDDEAVALLMGDYAERFRVRPGGYTRVLKLRQRMGLRMASIVIGDQAMVRPVPGPSCPTCDEEMRYKDMKRVTVEGQLGETELERAYYYCDRCRSGLFPPRPAVEPEGYALE